MSSIISTNNSGRLHIGFVEENSGTKVLGKSINMYRNFITKFFTRLFRVSIQIEIDGKMRCLNKKSFNKHIKSILDANHDEIFENGYDRTVIQHKDIIKMTETHFGENFSSRKRMNQFKKMLKEMAVNNTQAVKREILKGAYLDREFYTKSDLRDDAKQLFWFSQRAAERDLYKYNRYTPLAFAIEKNNQSLAEFILNMKGGDFSADKKLSVEIISKRTRGSRSVPHEGKTDHYRIGKNGNLTFLDPEREDWGPI